MKSFFHLLSLVVVAGLLSSCGDSHDKLIKDQVAWVGDMTETLNGVADGSLSSSEAASKIEALGKKGDEFMERKKSLNEGKTPEELMEVGTKHAKAIAGAFQEYMKAVGRLSKSGRMTQELADAIENMKGL